MIFPATITETRKVSLAESEVASLAITLINQVFDLQHGDKIQDGKLCYDYEGCSIAERWEETRFIREATEADKAAVAVLAELKKKL